MVKTLKSKVKTRWWLEFANPKAMFISSQGNWSESIDLSLNWTTIY